MSAALATTTFGNASSESNDTTTTTFDTRTDSSVTTPVGGSVYGNSASFGQGASIGSYQTTDQGAVAAGERVATLSIQSAERGLGTLGGWLGAALTDASGTIKEKGQSDLTKFLTPLVWIVGIVAVAVIAGVVLFKRK